ncbi:MAG TPA: ribokinase [Gaiellaceae bacterium]|nr:ribokinase [Gaiellaceae bacterium]
MNHAILQAATKPARTPSICVVGAALIDLIAYVPRLPTLGETLHGTDFRSGFGGKGANQAVMAARLGAHVSLVSRVGRDSFGDEMIANLVAQRVDTSYVSIDDEAPSGVAPIAVDPRGENSIIIVTGANDRLTADEVERARPAIAGADVLACQLELSHEATLAALRIAREESTTTILNPAPAAAALPPEIYALTDVLCPNEPEAELLLGHAVSDAAEAARTLRERGCGAVVLTLGKRGCLVSTTAEERLIPSPQADAIDTTGAGDAFVGSLAVRLALGDSLADAATYANRAAALSVTRRGTQSSFPSANEVAAGVTPPVA